MHANKMSRTRYSVPYVLVCLAPKSLGNQTKLKRKPRATETLKCFAGRASWKGHSRKGQRGLMRGEESEASLEKKRPDFDVTVFLFRVY